LAIEGCRAAATSCDVAHPRDIALPSLAPNVSLICGSVLSKAVLDIRGFCEDPIGLLSRLAQIEYAPAHLGALQNRSGFCECGTIWAGSDQSPSLCEAISAPVTRARIFSKAVSLDVEVSSPNGENPQSSALPNWLICMIVRRMKARPM
jgi:hypothetical protein